MVPPVRAQINYLGHAGIVDDMPFTIHGAVAIGA